MSVLEVSHRGADFIECAADAEAALRSVAGVPDDYRVLFLAGGATGQFSKPIKINSASIIIRKLQRGNRATADQVPWKKS